MTRKQFVERMMEACRIARLKGAVFNEPVCIAQAAHESNWGRSGLTTKACNLFGIKAGAGWDKDTLELPTKEWSKDRGWYTTMARWRAYPSWNECIVDYAAVLGRLWWYQDAMAAIDDPEAFLAGLLPRDGEPGWATDPDYADKVRAAGRAVERLGGPKWGGVAGG